MSRWLEGDFKQRRGSRQIRISTDWGVGSSRIYQSFVYYLQSSGSIVPASQTQGGDRGGRGGRTKDLSLPIRTF